MNREAFLEYIAGEVNDARRAKGLEPVPPDQAEAIYTVLDNFFDLWSTE